MIFAFCEDKIKCVFPLRIQCSWGILIVQAPVPGSLYFVVSLLRIDGNYRMAVESTGNYYPDCKTTPFHENRVSAP